MRRRSKPPRPCTRTMGASRRGMESDMVVNASGGEGGLSFNFKDDKEESVTGDDYPLELAGAPGDSYINLRTSKAWATRETRTEHGADEGGAGQDASGLAGNGRDGAVDVPARGDRGLQGHGVQPHEGQG